MTGDAMDVAPREIVLHVTLVPRAQISAPCRRLLKMAAAARPPGPGPR